MSKALLLAAALVGAFGAAASAAEVEVKLLNRGSAGVMVFEPAFVQVQPGDTVKFVATDKGHNVESIDGMLPEGAAAVAGKMGEDTAVTFDRPGVYGVRCKPHYGMGMVALIVVGKPANLDQAKAVKQVGKAKKVFEELLEKAEAVK